MAALRPAAKTLTKRDTASYLRPIAQALIDALGLEPPITQAPGYWRRSDGFAQVSAGVIKHDLRHATDRMRALLTFDTTGIQPVVARRLAEFFPHPDQLGGRQRRERWSRSMMICKEVRRERVRIILRELSKEGIGIDPDSIVVHRVSSTFFGVMSLRDSQRLVRLSRRGYRGIKKIKVDEVLGHT